MTPRGRGGGREVLRGLQAGLQSPGPPDGEEAQEGFSRAGARECSRSWLGTSLVAQWLRIRLPMQGTRVRSLVREDPT